MMNNAVGFLKNHFREVLLLLFISTIVSVFFIINIGTHPISDNDRSRLGGIISIVRYDSLNIDETAQAGTGDRAEYSNKIYSSKPPLLHIFLGYATKAFFTLKPTLISNDVAIYRFSTFLTNVIPIILLLVIFYACLRKFDIPKNSSIIFSTLLILGTLIFSYSMYLNNHILGSLIQLGILYFLLFNKEKQSKSIYIVLGFLVAFSFVIDITYGLVLAPITLLYLIYISPKNYSSIMMYFTLGALPLLIIHFYFMYIQFNTLIPIQIQKDIYFSYENSKWIGELSGIEALKHSIPTRFFNYSFGSHGFFLYHPIFLISLFYRPFWKNKLWIYTISILFSYLLLSAVMQHNYGGSSFGPRRFIPLIPLFMYLTVIVWTQIKNTFVKKYLFPFLFFLTVCISWIGYSNPWNNYDVYKDDNTKELYFPLVSATQDLYYCTKYKFNPEESDVSKIKYIYCK